MQSNLMQELARADQLPSAPSIALRILELSRNDQVDIAELTEVLSHDPALVARLLRTANSSLFGHSREISSIHQAVLVLGLRSVNLVALSFSILSTWGRDSRQGFDYVEFWTKMTATALGMRILAERRLPDLKDEAFLIGLLSGFGQLILTEYAYDRYAPVLELCRKSSRPLSEVEREQLGSTSAELGADLLASWGLPERICSTIRDHLDPERSKSAPTSDRSLVHLLRFCSVCGDVLSGSDVEAGAVEIQRLGNRYLDLDTGSCCAVLLEILEGLPGIAVSLDLETADTNDLAEIAAQVAELRGKWGRRSEEAGGVEAAE